MRAFATLTEPDGSIYMYHIPEEISELRFLNSSRIVKKWNEEEDFPIIQGFPDNYIDRIIDKFSMTWLYTMSGNDVTVPVAKTIGEIYD
jgi:hypothetical protein